MGRPPGAQAMLQPLPSTTPIGPFALRGHERSTFRRSFGRRECDDRLAKAGRAATSSLSGFTCVHSSVDLLLQHHEVQPEAGVHATFHAMTMRRQALRAGRAVARTDRAANRDRQAQAARAPASSLVIRIVSRVSDCRGRRKLRLCSGLESVPGPSRNAQALGDIVSGLVVARHRRRGSPREVVV